MRAPVRATVNDGLKRVNIRVDFELPAGPDSEVEVGMLVIGAVEMRTDEVGGDVAVVRWTDD